MLETIVRFAPSPTGNIHIGNARTALLNWLFAKKNNGKFILRMDDTDLIRSTKEFADGIKNDVDWLGIKPDIEFNQSDRFDRYNEIKNMLIDKGLLYPCYETAEELEYGRKRRIAKKLPPIYDRKSLKLTNKQKKEYEDSGRKPHWRFLLPNFDKEIDNFVRTEVSWEDLCRGHEKVDLSSLSDPVLIREDGSYLYTMTSVIDDFDTKVSHIIRGADHITNTAVQISIFKALGDFVPNFGHHNLLTDASGEGFSKRTGSMSIRTLREKGYEPESVASIAVNVGTSHAVKPINSVDELLVEFDLSKISRSASKFEENDIININTKCVMNMSLDKVYDRLKNYGILDNKENFWSAVKGNCSVFNDVKKWYSLIENDIESVIKDEDVDFITEAKNLLPDDPWTNDTFKNWANLIKEKTGRKGRDLFMPIRLALTGLEHGPELVYFLPLLGRDRCLDRLTIKNSCENKI